MYRTCIHALGSPHSFFFATRKPKLGCNSKCFSNSAVPTQKEESVMPSTACSTKLNAIPTETRKKSLQSRSDHNYFFLFFSFFPLVQHAQTHSKAMFGTCPYLLLKSMCYVIKKKIHVHVIHSSLVWLDEKMFRMNLSFHACKMSHHH